MQRRRLPLQDETKSAGGEQSAISDSGMPPLETPLLAHQHREVRIVLGAIAVSQDVETMGHHHMRGAFEEDLIINAWKIRKLQSRTSVWPDLDGADRLFSPEILRVLF